MRRFISIRILVLVLVFGTVCPKSAHALDRDLRTILVTAAYGLVAGTALGLASLPLTQDSRAIFLGSSMGLYLGTAVGFYHVGSREDAENPLRSGSPRGWEEFHALVNTRGQFGPATQERKVPLFHATVLSF